MKLQQSVLIPVLLVASIAPQWGFGGELSNAKSSAVSTYLATQISATAEDESALANLSEYRRRLFAFGRIMNKRRKSRSDIELARTILASAHTSVDNMIPSDQAWIRSHLHSRISSLEYAVNSNDWNTLQGAIDPIGQALGIPSLPNSTP